MRQRLRAVTRLPDEIDAFLQQLCGNGLRRRRVIADEAQRGVDAGDAREADALEPHGLEDNRQLRIMAEVVGEPGLADRQAERGIDPGLADEIVADERLTRRQQVVRRRDPAADDAQVLPDILERLQQLRVHA